MGQTQHGSRTFYTVRLKRWCAIDRACTAIELNELIFPEMDLLAKIRTIPTEPGVYLCKNAEVIYVGKAKNLRCRVAR
jgi:hypothetical protein